MDSVSPECLKRIIRIYTNNPSAQGLVAPVLEALRELLRASMPEHVTPHGRDRAACAG